MKAVVFAYHNMGIVGLEALKKEDFQIEAIFSHLDDPEENCWFDSVVKWGNKNEILVFCPENVNKPEWVEKILHLAPDVIFSFYYRRLLGKGMLNIPPSGALNLHGSLLPAYRGRCPINWVLVNGEQRTGITLHYMVEEADAGDIIGQKEVKIEFNDTALTLYRKLCGKAKELLEESLPLIKKGIAPRRPQDITKGSYFGGRTPEDGKINWQWPVMRIYNLVRGVTDPYPGAFTYLPDGKKMMIWRATPERNRYSKHAVGTVEQGKEEIFVRAFDGSLKLMDIEVAGEHMKGQSIFKYFKNRKGVILT